MYIGNLLAQEKLQFRDRGDVEIDDGAHLFLAYHGKGAQDGRDEQQQQGDGPRHHGHQAIDVRVIAKTVFNGEQPRPHPGGSPGGQLLGGAGFQPELVHAFRIAADILTLQRHGPIHPGPHRHRASPPRHPGRIGAGSRWRGQARRTASAAPAHRSPLSAGAGRSSGWCRQY